MLKDKKRQGQEKEWFTTRKVSKYHSHNNFGISCKLQRISAYSKHEDSIRERSLKGEK